MEKWIHEFADSLSHQDFQDFDLVMINDGLDVKQLKVLDQKFNCKIIPSTGSFAGNRNTGFAYLIQCGYRFVIFTDADDLMDKNRLSHCRELLQNNEIVINDLTLITSKGESIKKNYLAERLGDFKKIQLNDILDYNIMGLGNSSARVEILNEIIIPEDIEVVDWYLFTMLLKRGHKAVFTSSTSTLYRQHDSNILGFHKPDEANINMLAERKHLHYFHLQTLSDHHQKRFTEFSKLVEKLKDPVFKKKYLKKINDQIPEYPFWFESIKPD
jgi:glycosyltransferase involved in cell wall biosynthesis